MTPEFGIGYRGPNRARICDPTLRKGSPRKELRGRFSRSVDKRGRRKQLVFAGGAIGGRRGYMEHLIEWRESQAVFSSRHGCFASMNCGQQRHHGSDTRDRRKIVMSQELASSIKYRKREIQAGADVVQDPQCGLAMAMGIALRLERAKAGSG